MNNKNPKYKFLQRLSNIVQEFEEETGTEIHNIHFERYGRKTEDYLLQISQVTNIEMEIK